MTGRLTRTVLRSYPPSFRARYGAELRTLVDDLPRSRRLTLNLVIGALRAWLRPAFAGPDATRRRLLATASTTWVAWCAGFLVAPAVSFALLDPPTHDVAGSVRHTLAAGEVLFFAGWGCALLGAAPVVWRAVVPALHARRWSAVLPLVPVMALGVLVGAALLVLGLTSDPGAAAARPSMAVTLVGAVLVTGIVVFVVGLGAGPVVTMRRLNTDVAMLRAPAVLAVPVAVILTAMTGCALAAAAMSGSATLFSSTVPVVAALGVAGVASAVALVSAARGVRAAWAG